MTADGINRYDAVTAIDMIASGAFTATDYLRACLDRIAEREADVGAWTYLAREKRLLDRPLSTRAAKQGCCAVSRSR